ncbi:hypothetical protein ACS0TY_009834 [Phlomoides rotata]
MIVQNYKKNLKVGVSALPKSRKKSNKKYWKLFHPKVVESFSCMVMEEQERLSYGKICQEVERLIRDLSYL